MPFIGASDSNNGVTGMTTWEKIERCSKVGYGPNEPISQKKYSGNCICVTNNGSVGYAYYQATAFTCSHDVNPLYLKNGKLNRYIGLFLAACIEKQRVCFEYARKWRPKRMKQSRLMLPIKQDGSLDLLYMECYMKDIENRRLNNYLEYKSRHSFQSDKTSHSETD